MENILADMTMKIKSYFNSQNGQVDDEKIVAILLDNYFTNIWKTIVEVNSPSPVDESNDEIQDVPIHINMPQEVSQRNINDLKENMALGLDKLYAWMHWWVA